MLRAVAVRCCHGVLNEGCCPVRRFTTTVGMMTFVACVLVQPALAQAKPNRSIAGSDYEKALRRSAAFSERIRELTATAEAKAKTREGAGARFAIIQAYEDAAAELPGGLGLSHAVKRECEAILRECAKEPDSCALARKSLGDHYASHRKFDLAAREYTRAVSDYPDTPGAALARVAVAECLASPFNEQRDRKAALAQLQAVLPDLASCALADAKARLQIGDVQFAQKQLSAAIDTYHACIVRHNEAGDPELGDVIADARQHLALCYSRNKEYEKGAEVLAGLLADYRGRKLRNQFGGSTQLELARFRRAHMLHAAGHTVEAVRELRTLRSESPGCFLAIRAQSRLRKWGASVESARAAGDPSALQAAYASGYRRWGCGVIALAAGAHCWMASG